MHLRTEHYSGAPNILTKNVTFSIATALNMFQFYLYFVSITQLIYLYMFLGDGKGSIPAETEEGRSSPLVPLQQRVVLHNIQSVSVILVKSESISKWSIDNKNNIFAHYLIFVTVFQYRPYTPTVG